VRERLIGERKGQALLDEDHHDGRRAATCWRRWPFRTSDPANCVDRLSVSAVCVGSDGYSRQRNNFPDFGTLGEWWQYRTLA